MRISDFLLSVIGSQSLEGLELLLAKRAKVWQVSGDRHGGCRAVMEGK